VSECVCVCVSVYVCIYTNIYKNTSIGLRTLLPECISLSPSNHFIQTVEYRNPRVTSHAIPAKITCPILLFNGPPPKRNLHGWNLYCQTRVSIVNGNNAYIVIREVTEMWHQKTICRTTILSDKPDTFHTRQKRPFRRILQPLKLEKSVL